MKNLSPSIKGQLTKAYKAYGPHPDLFGAVRRIFERVMPREQAKHAARKYVMEVAK
ncbi:MAG: hypothetical protein P4K94_01380 [Terracidiphilus sp.]|nr:hypothetical protein [Terracidiphilus sp.]